MVIITRNHYILAAKIHHITLDESIEYVDARNKNSRYISVACPKFTITIQYVPDNGQTTSNGRDDTRECSITLTSKHDAHAVYRDLVQQIREQMPDQLYMDQALDRLLNQHSLEKIAESEKNDAAKQEELLNDGRSKKIRTARKKKR